MVAKHTKEVINLQLEMSQIKYLIKKQMKFKIFFLHEAIVNITKINVGDIVTFMAASLSH